MGRPSTRSAQHLFLNRRRIRSNFGYNYLSPAAPLLAPPSSMPSTVPTTDSAFLFRFLRTTSQLATRITRLTGQISSPSLPTLFFNLRNRVSYIDNYMLSIQRQLTGAALLPVSYVGNQGTSRTHARLSQPRQSCYLPELSSVSGPFGEDNPYTIGTGQTYQGTRVGQGPEHQENTSDSSIANSNYDPLGTTPRYNRHLLYAHGTMGASAGTSPRGSGCCSA